jgi:ATPase subunit of ABC transporter with duplicated ATPase domains
LERELAWIKMSNQDKVDLSRNRLIEFEQLVAREAAAAKEEGGGIVIAPGPELGQQVIEFKNVSKQYDDKLLFKDLSFSVPRSAVIGLVGPNGTGKTTLFRMIAGQEKPDTGEVLVGSAVKLAYVDQGREALAGTHGLVQEIGEGSDDVTLGKLIMPVRSYLSRFGFKGADQQKNVNQLSGGERNRAHLAKVLKIGGNVLLLDEPTNDLDVNTLRLLEEAINNYSGCVLVISHDRFFLNRICTHVLVWEGDGNVRFFTGNYSAYEEWRAKEFGNRLFENRRNRYRRLVTA